MPETRIINYKEFERNLLKKYPQAIEDNVWPKVISKGASIVLREMKSQAGHLTRGSELSTGALKEAVGKRIWKKQGGFIGVRSGFERDAIPPRYSKTGIIDPYKYDHLFDQGFRHRSGKQVAGKEYIKKTEQVSFERTVNEMEKVAKNEIDKQGVKVMNR